MARELKLLDANPFKWVNTPAESEYALTMRSLAAATASIGARAFLGNKFSPEMVLSFKYKSLSAPTAGNFINLYLAYSIDATTTASAGYSNAAASITGADLLDKQFQFQNVGYLSVDNITTEQRVFFLFSPITPYVQPVIYNGTTVAFSATAADHELLLIPTYRVFTV